MFHTFLDSVGMVSSVCMGYLSDNIILQPTLSAYGDSKLICFHLSINIKTLENGMQHVGITSFTNFLTCRVDLCGENCVFS